MTRRTTEQRHKVLTATLVFGLALAGLCLWFSVRSSSRVLAA
jgi:hypothetical protein